jgi:uptake hydrogenase large subunit
MSIEGRLTIDLDRGADGSGRAQISSSRPLGLAQAFVGKTAEETVRTLPLLFAVCGIAQGAASTEACERALGIEADGETRALRRLLVCLETLREHLVRAVMDWRRFLGLEPRSDEMLRVMRLCANARRSLDPKTFVFTIGAGVGLDRARAMPAIAEAAQLVEDLVLGEPIEAWRARVSTSDFEDWCAADKTPAQQLVSAVLDRGWESAGQAAVSFLPDLPDAGLAECLFGPDTEAFIAAPTWNGIPRETTAFARQAASPLVGDVTRLYGSGLLARLAGLLVEIAELPRIMSEIVENCAVENEPEGRDDGRPMPGRGLAHVEAARGRLVHGVEIEDNIVRRYAILAPTEWNFHGEGGAVRGLAHIAGRAENVREIADLFVTAVDPCVGYELRVH